MSRFVFCFVASLVPLYVLSNWVETSFCRVEQTTRFHRYSNSIDCILKGSEYPQLSSYQPLMSAFLYELYFQLLGVIDIAVFNRVVMYVVYMITPVFFISHGMFPKSSLPDAFFFSMIGRVSICVET